MWYSGWIEQADENGFTLLAPQGTDQSWNAGDCCGGAEDNDVDDVDFLEKIVRDTTGDKTRVYVGGHSNGCAMAQRFAAEKSDLVAAVACHAFYLLMEAPENYSGVSILTILGEDDEDVLYDGGIRKGCESNNDCGTCGGDMQSCNEASCNFGFHAKGGCKDWDQDDTSRKVCFSNMWWEDCFEKCQDVQECRKSEKESGHYAHNSMVNMQRWREHNECSGEMVTDESDERYVRYTYENCKNNTVVASLKILNTGHGPYKKLREDGTDVDTTKLAWEFAKQFKKESWATKLSTIFVFVTFCAISMF